ILAEAVHETMTPFEGVDRAGAAYEQLMAAQEQLATVNARGDFAAGFLRCEALFELLWPDTRLRPVENDYRWLARVYASIRPSVDANALLWHRLGEKTRDLIGAYISGVAVEQAEAEAIAIDAGTFEALRQLAIFDDEPERRSEPPTVD